MWDLTSGCTMRSFAETDGIVNQLVQVPNNMIEPNLIQFFSVGNNNHICQWSFTYKGKESQLVKQPIQLPADSQKMNFTCGAWSKTDDTNRMLMLGTSDGAIVIYNPVQEIFVEEGRRAIVTNG